MQEALSDEALRGLVMREAARCRSLVIADVEMAMRCCRAIEELHGIPLATTQPAGNDMISVERLPRGSALLRVIASGKPQRRSDGKPPFIGTAILAPSRDDAGIGILIGMLLLEEATRSRGWRRKLMRALSGVAQQLGYRRLLADTDGRPRDGWHDAGNGWIGFDIEEGGRHE